MSRRWPRAAGLQEAQPQGRGHTKAGGRKPGRQGSPALTAARRSGLPPRHGTQSGGDPEPRLSRLQSHPDSPNPHAIHRAAWAVGLSPSQGLAARWTSGEPLPPGPASDQLQPAPSARQQSTTSLVRGLEHDSHSCPEPGGLQTQVQGDPGDKRGGLVRSGRQHQLPTLRHGSISLREPSSLRAECSMLPTTLTRRFGGLPRQ